MASETTELLEGGVEDSKYIPIGGAFDDKAYKSQTAKAGRSASIAALGGSSTLGTFEFKEVPNVKGLPKSYSVTAMGAPNAISPTQLGRQELYEQVPFQAVFGLQKKERSVSVAFASYAAEMDVMEQIGLTDEEKKTRRSQASMIILDELVFDSNLVTTPLIFAIIVAVASQFLVGYNTGVMNAPASVVFPEHSTVSWSLAVAAFAVGGPFGAAYGGQMADKRGRRGALLIDSWTFLVGGVLQTFSPNMVVMIIARFIIGFASGFSSVLVPIYLGELAPPNLRGMLGTLTQFSLVIGILVSDLFAFPFANPRGWRVLFFVTALTAGIQLLMAPFLLESPRWLLGRDPNSLKARFIIKQLRGMRNDDEVETEVGLFVMGGAAQQQETPSQWGTLKDMFSKPKTRILIISGLFLNMAQQFCGINAVFYYSTMFFEGVISNPLVGTTIVGAVNVLATYVALLLMDSCGRRTLTLWSSGGMFLSCVFIVLSLLNYFNHTVALVAVNAYVTFFEIGLGPIPSLIVAEMFDSKYVTVAMATCSQVNWTCNFIIGLVFPYMNQYLGPYSFGPFAVVLLMVFLYAATVLPETQGTTPEELAKEIHAKNSKSIVYHSNSEANAGDIDAEWRKAMEQLMQEEGGTIKDDFAGFEPAANPELV